MANKVRGGGRPPPRIQAKVPEPSLFKAELTRFQKFISFFIRPLRGYFENNSIKEQLMNQILSKIGPQQIYKPLLEKFSNQELENFNNALNDVTISFFLNTFTRNLKSSKEGIIFLQKYLPVLAQPTKKESLIENVEELGSAARTALSRDLSEIEGHTIIRFLLEHHENKFQPMRESIQAFFDNVKNLNSKQKIDELMLVLKYPEVKKNQVIEKMLLTAAFQNIDGSSLDTKRAIAIAKLGHVYEPKGTLSLLPYVHQREIKDLAVIDDETRTKILNAVQQANTSIFKTADTSIPIHFPIKIENSKILLQSFNLQIKTKFKDNKYLSTFSVSNKGKTLTRDYVSYSERDIEKNFLLFKSDFMNEFLK